MKVRCITDECNFLTKGNIYDVYLDMHLYPYIYDDVHSRAHLAKNENIFEVIRPNTQQKNLRDEFAMAAMKGDWAAQNENGLAHYSYSTQDIEYLQKAAKSYYMMADAMLEVRNENEK